MEGSDRTDVPGGAISNESEEGAQVYDLNAYRRELPNPAMDLVLEQTLGDFSRLGIDADDLRSLWTEDSQELIERVKALYKVTAWLECAMEPQEVGPWLCQSRPIFMNASALEALVNPDEREDAVDRIEGFARYDARLSRRV